MEIQRIDSETQQRILNDKLDERLKISLQTDPSHPDHLKYQVVAYDLCKSDWKFYVNNFCWIQDPEADNPDNKDLPFLLWDYQEKAGDELVKAVEQGYDLPVEKCRKLGLTWLVLVIIQWGWHFREWDALIGSSKAQNADVRGDMGTLFEKIRYITSKMPKWMFPTPFDHYSDKVMFLKNPTNGAQIVGEGNNANFGRSDRKKVIFLDEFTSWEQTDRSAYQGCSATTKCRISVSTPNTRGVNCYFYQIVNDHKKKNKPLLTLPWTLHPEFAKGLRPTTEDDLAYQKFSLEETSPWLENEIRRASDNQSVAQEILINYEASMTGKVFGDFRYEENVDDDIEYNPDLPLYRAWDFGLDQTAILWIQPDKKNKTVNIIDEYVNDGDSREGSDIYHYIEVVENKEYKSGIDFGDPHSGENRQLAARGQSNASILRRNGLIFKSQRVKIKNRVQAGRNIISQVRINSQKCPRATEMFISWQNGKSGTPEHSTHSHIGEAFTYYAINIKQDKKIEQKKTTHQPTSSGVTL